MKALFGSRPELARVRREGFARGIRTVAPLLIGTGIWGLVTGVAMVKVGLTTAQAIAMTLLVFSGTVQLASLPLIAADAPLWVVHADGGSRQPALHHFLGRAASVFSPIFDRPPMAAQLLHGRHELRDVSVAVRRRSAGPARHDRTGVVLSRHERGQLDRVADDVDHRHRARRRGAGAMGSRVHRDPGADCDDAAVDCRQAGAGRRCHCRRHRGGRSRPAAEARAAGRGRRRYRCRDGYRDHARAARDETGGTA